MHVFFHSYINEICLLFAEMLKIDGDHVFIAFWNLSVVFHVTVTHMKKYGLYRNASEDRL